MKNIVLSFRIILIAWNELTYSDMHRFIEFRLLVTSAISIILESFWVAITNFGVIQAHAQSINLPEISKHILSKICSELRVKNLGKYQNFVPDTQFSRKPKLPTLFNFRKLVLLCSTFQHISNKYS